MKPALLCMLGFFLLSSLLHGRAYEIKATLAADETTIPPGGSVTLTCSVGRYAGLTFELFRKPQPTYQTRVSPRSDGVFIITEGGIYTCRGFKTEHNFMTTMSDEVIIQETEIKANLKADNTTIPPGGSVTLTCSVDKPADLTFELFRGSSSTYQTRVSPRSDVVFIITEGGIYTCIGFKLGTNFVTSMSDEVTINKRVSNRVSVTSQPNRSLIYRGEKVTLRCEIQDDGRNWWTYEWKPTNRNFPSSSEYMINSATDADSGEYSCKGRRGYEFTGWSEAIRLTVSSDKPRATLKAEKRIIPAGGSVTLTCSVEGSTGWEFYWIRNGQYYSVVGSSRNTEPDGTIRVSEGGEYSCRGRRGDSSFESETSKEVTIEETAPNKPSLILQPNWSQIYIGEKVTLRCEIQGGTEWTYEWRSTNRNFPSSSEYSIISATESHSGKYSCRGKRGFSFTPWSNVVKITVSPKPHPVLSVSPSWPNPGASVTLSCEGLEHQSAGWRFFWYKAVPDTSKQNYLPSYSYELLPGSTNGTEQNSFIINGPTHTAGYKCRAEREEPKFYTDYSEPKFFWSADPRPAASLSVNPDRVQHFRSDSVSLSCEGNSAEWRVRRFIERDGLSDFTCSYWGTMTGSTCTFKPYYYMDGVFWCESKSGEFSNAVNITVQNDNYDGVILVSPVHPVTEGDPVTLSCRDKKQNLLSNVFFYHNDKLINNDSREELKISAVSKSDEGFYKCQHSGKESPRSWMSVRVTVSSPVSSSFPVMLIVGPVVGIVVIILIILLILLWRCRRSKDLCCIRSKGSEVRGQSSTTNQPEGPEYKSLSHGNVHLYEMIGSAEASGHADEAPEVTYSLIEMKSFRKDRRQGGPEEGAVYSEVKTGAAGKSGPAAAEASVYSEIRKAPAVENSAAM
ncbi:basement membrane-specific heparan sulfate proteoglycan core protein-like isoform X2 [Xiphophorus hellerii]|uniref:basement membrane-specific heparan sulfate proteoglycan core protein-like isoform X2 n=1 Tax=Xiphophorus hellerii TaxID=8084 RepID=UPI0013B43F4D|nr:basement membrane-specific heparan sulfate proteoglycan core protein-like isoform X2 [Xiphophorus hellerii]